MMYQFPQSRLLWAFFALAILAGYLPKASGQILTRVQTAFEGSGTPVVSGITGAFGVALSPDNAHVYVVGTGPPGNTGGSIAVFSRITDDQSVDFGKVTFVEEHIDDGIVGGLIDGLKSARQVEVSPDGKHVYVASFLDNAVVVFVRDTDDQTADFGKLTYLETHKDGVGVVDGLGGAHGITVSSDGEHLYVASRSESAGDDTVAVFTRDDSTGALTFVEFHKNNVGPVTGLKDCERLTLSPDGKHLYVASEGGDSASPGSVAVFSRNTNTMSMDFGKLTFVESHIDGVNGADGLLNANDVAVSPDGKHVYVTNQALLDESEDWLAIFSRDETTGALTFVSKLGASAADLCASLFENGGVASEVVVSPDGKTVIASNNWVGAVVSFSRNAETGILTIADQECDEAADEGIVTINAVAMSPDGKHVYTTGLGPPASLVVFSGIEMTVEFKDSSVEILDGDTSPSDSENEGTDFGALDPVSGSVTRTYRIWNDGFANLDLTGPIPVSLTGAGAAEFSLTQPGSLVLTPGEMTEFTVTFDPSTEGIHNAVVNIGNNDPDESPYDFQIIGSGVNGTPDITVEFLDSATDIPDGDVSPSGEDAEGTDFGKFLTAGVSETRTFKIRNDGVVNLNLAGPDPVSLAGTGAAQFGVTQPVLNLLAPNQSTTFDVQYSPAADGVHLATVSIASDDPDENPFDYQVAGISRAAERAALQRSIGNLKRKIKRLSKRLKKSKNSSTVSKVKRLKRKLRKLEARFRSL